VGGWLSAHHRAKRRRLSLPTPSFTTQFMAALASPVFRDEIPRAPRSERVESTPIAPPKKYCNEMHARMFGQVNSNAYNVSLAKAVTQASGSYAGDEIRR
jgi:hypothetical protein